MSYTALVSDTSDPSGTGMFSHLGRFTSQKYTVFKKKDEILQRRHKVYRPSPIPFKVVRSDSVDSDFSNLRIKRGGAG
jgi:hypothetical protein